MFLPVRTYILIVMSSQVYVFVAYNLPVTHLQNKKLKSVWDTMTKIILYHNWNKFNIYDWLEKKLEK